MSANDIFASVISDKVNATPKSRKLYLEFYKRADKLGIDQGEVSFISYQKLFLDQFMSSSPEVIGYVIAQFHYMLVQKKAEMIVIAVAEPPQGNTFTDANNKILETRGASSIGTKNRVKDWIPVITIKKQLF
jgi:hypothetical protein